MKIFNTLTRQKDEFIPQVEGEVKMYACGPTVYNFIHIGNARPLIVFDTLRRYFEWRGYKVNFVQNFTDIDDKIIKRANEEGITSEAVAEKYIQEYFTDVKGLGVREATVHITPGEDQSYILDADSVVNASASVFVEMDGAAKLTSDQAAAIRRYVANGVQGLLGFGSMIVAISRERSPMPPLPIMISVFGSYPISRRAAVSATAQRRERKPALGV